MTDLENMDSASTTNMGISIILPLEGHVKFTFSSQISMAWFYIFRWKNTLFISNTFAPYLLLIANT